MILVKASVTGKTSLKKNVYILTELLEPQQITVDIQAIIHLPLSN